MKHKKALAVGAVLLGIVLSIMAVFVGYYLCFKLMGLSFRSWVGKQDFSFEAKCKTTEDGFVYYVDKKNRDGICIISLPEQEEVTIPEYIEGKRVTQIGFEEVGLGWNKEHWVDFGNIKKISIFHSFEIPFIYNCTNIETVTYVDYPYSGMLSHLYEPETTTVGDRMSEHHGIFAEFHLIRSNKERDFGNFEYKYIYIPKYVTVIESGVFDGLEDVIIKTSYKKKPKGWEEGWNGNCEVIWDETSVYIEDDWVIEE